MNIAEVGEKIKSAAAVLARKDVYAALIIVFVGFASFFLGALWDKDRGAPQVSIQSPTEEQGTSTDPYVASWTSKIYRLTTCPGVSAINDANKVYFATAEDAEAAGYTAAKNCKM